MDILTGLGMYQLLISLEERRERDIIYEKARRSADARGKPLLVAGGHKRRHGMGDVCMDIDARSCAGAPVILRGDIRDIPLPDKWAGAVFAAHVLEHLPTVADARLAIAELERVADSVFIVVPGKSNPIAWIHPDHHLWLRFRNGRIEIQQR